MAHEIASINGLNMFASVEANANDKAWHKLGQTIVRERGTYTDGTEIMSQAGLDQLIVDKKPIYTMGDNGQLTQVPSKVAITRRDNGQVYSVMGDGFEVIQAQEIREFADAVVGESGAFYDTAGALFGGAVVFFTLKLPSSIMGGDNVNKSLTIAHANDGTMALTVCASMTRVVCANTLDVALKGSKDKCAIRHTRNWKNKVEEARRVVQITATHFEKVEKAFEAMRMKKVNDTYVQGFVNTLFAATSKVEGKIPLQTLEKRNLVSSLFQRGLGNEGQTKWDLFNGVTEAIDHHFGGRVTEKSIMRTDEGANPEADQRFMRIKFGSGARLRQEAFDLLMAN